MIVVSSEESGVIKSWNFKSEIKPFEFIGHKAAVHQVIYYPTKKYIASASSDETVIIWTNEIKYHKEVIKSHSAPVRTIDFSSDGQMLLSGSDDKSIKIWKLCLNRNKERDWLSTKFRASILGHTNWIRSAQFSPDSIIIASCSDDKTVKVWDLAKKK